ncbi:MAG: hypothetical protein K0U42_08715 [Actinomycetia bacterium]|nr:hypothetical protein [Actinomycetes bacterium]
MRIRSLVAVCATVALSAGLLAPAASADDYQFMGTRWLEQAVLRAQMPTTLGSWTQNAYYTDTDVRLTRATVCWGAKGEIRLPAAKNVGAVGYNVGQFISGSISIFQYKDQAAADAALSAMRNASCSDTPMLPTESETLVKGSSGSDFTDDTTTGYEAGSTHIEDGMRVYQTITTTFRGLAAVQTQISRFVKLPQSMKQQQNVVNKLAAVDRKWQAKAIKALENFGTGIAR